MTSGRPFFLNGNWCTSGEEAAVHNPFDGSDLGSVCLAAADQVEIAVASAHAAFEQTRRQSAATRVGLLSRIADGIRDRESEFVETLVAEAGKPVTFARAEVSRAELTFRFAAQAASEVVGGPIAVDASAPGEGHIGYIQRVPIGVILGITPFNFPLNLVAHKVAPCIASGNAMVLKPALKTPLSALLLAEVLEEAGLPAGQVNVVPFDHSHIPPLLIDPRIRMLSFTGSDTIGFQLKAQAARQKVTLELGGNAAVILCEDADWKAAIPKIASGAFGYAGQSCISVQRVFVDRTCWDDFLPAFVSHVEKEVRAGDPTDARVTVGPMISASACGKVAGWVREAESAGARLLTPLRVDGDNLLHPVVLTDVPAGAAVSCEEAFAPIVVVEPVASFDEAIARTNDSRYGLQAGVFTNDYRRILRAFEELEVGGVLVNEVPTFRVENMPYGGFKDSGVGREGVRYAVEEMTEPRLLVIRR